MNNYFTKSESEQFAFFRVPKALMTDHKYKQVSAEAKLLYGLLLDTMSLSIKNDWADENGMVYIYFTIERIMNNLGCAHTKASNLLKELCECDLLDRKKQGLGKPTRLYVKKFIVDVENSKTTLQEVSKSDVLTDDNQRSRSTKTGSQDLSKSAPSNTNINKTNINKTNSINLSIKDEIENETKLMDRIDGTDYVNNNYAEIVEDIKFNIEYEILVERRGSQCIDEIVCLLTDTVCCGNVSVRIAGGNYPLSVVKSRFMKLKSEHVEYVLDRLADLKVPVRNIRAYMLTALYNAPSTMDGYYTAMAGDVL